MDGKTKALVQLANDHGRLEDRYEKAVRAHIDECVPIDGDEFWTMLGDLSKAIATHHRGLTHSKGAIDEFVRSRLFDNGHRFLGEQREHDLYWAGQRLATWEKIARFVRAHRKVKIGLRRICQQWSDLDMSDDSFGDFIDSLPLAGKVNVQLMNDGTIFSFQRLGVSLFQSPLEHFIMRNNENYIEMTLIDSLTEKLPTIAHDFYPDRPVELLEKDPAPGVVRGVDIQAILDALAPVLEKTTRPFPGFVQVNLTTSEHAALTKVIQGLQLADLVNYKRAQDSFPRLLNAVKLVLAIADHPELNPTEKIFLASKTRAQLDSALKFAEK